MLSDLFISITDAVFSYAIDKLDPAETIKSWLKRDPARLGFQKALARAYSAFARQYPDYTASLFDRSFLEKEAARELAKLLVWNQYPDPALLAKAWGKSLGLDSQHEFCQRATKPASDFLTWLEAELRAEPAFQALFDSRALDCLPKVESEIAKLTAEIKRGLDEALNQANEYEKEIVKIGGSVTGSNIVVGDKNQVSISNIYHQYYSGDYARLNDYYIPPDGVFQRVRADEFIGRAWLTAKVDDFLNSPKQKSGMFLLVGDAGVGKTSFMAHLVQERRYLHLFGEQIPGDANLPRALQSLGSQLVTHYQIDPYKDRDTLTQLAVFPDFLERLLRLAASKLTAGERIVIVCDALDEVGTFPDGNVLGLPNILPDGVYFILSQRPVNTKLPNLNIRRENLEAQGEGNLADMESYLCMVAKRPEIAGQIRSKGYSEEKFIQTLKEKSLGVWMYLHYVIREIENGSRAPLELESLPTGLVGYYADFWDDWRNGRKGRGEGSRKWDELYAPLLTTLAAAQEPITIEELIEWSNVNANSREVGRLLRESWRAFITEQETTKEKQFKPYHLSFRDFISGKVDSSKLPPVQNNLIEDLAAQTVDAHKRIVMIFEKECNGKWEKLARQEYPRLHLCVHLHCAQEYEKLTCLLTEGENKIAWAEARYDQEETYAGYLHDLTYVWEYAEQEKNFVLVMRCMLIENSITSLAANVPPRLIAELVKADVWNIAHSLIIIRQKPRDSEQADSLELLAPLIPPLHIPDALAIVRDFQDEYIQARVLSALAPFLPNEVKYQQLANASDIDDEIARGRVISALASQAPDDLKMQALETACGLKDNMARFKTLFAFTHFLPEILKGQILNETITTALNISDSSNRFYALSQMASHLSDEYKVQIFSDAVAIELDGNNENNRVKLLLALIPNLPIEFTDRALAAVNKIQNKSTRILALFALSPQLTKEQGKRIVDEALESVCYLQSENERSNTLINLVPYLSDKTKGDVYNIALRILNDLHRARALAALAPCMPVKLQARVFRGALNAASKVTKENLRVQILSALAPYIPNEYKSQIIKLALQIRSEINQSLALTSLFPYILEDEKVRVLKTILKIPKMDVRVRTLSEIIPILPIELRMQAIKSALSTISDIQDEYAHTRALISLVHHLPKELASQVLETANQTLNKIQEGDELVIALSELASCFPSDSMPKVFTFACEIDKEDVRAFALSKIAPCLPDSLMPDALDAISNMYIDFHRARTLAAFVPYLPERILPDALMIAREIKQPYSRVRALSALIPVLPTELSSQVLKEANTIASEIDDEYQNVTALVHKDWTKVA